MKTVFTNGCFDVLHPGHVDLLERARRLGDRLVVGLNSDASVRALKGPGRPFVPQEQRAIMLRSLRSVDEVIIFDEATPERLIEELAPDVLVKGGDWPVDRIVGAEGVLRRGGRVLSLPVRLLYSTTALVKRIASSADSFPAVPARSSSPEPKIVDSFRGRKVLVLGDIMLDRYWIGSANRISPEAPVPIINKRGSTLAPGGAGNVAANISSLGGIPILVGVVGDDDAGRELRGALKKRGVDLDHLAIDPDRPTTVKTRIIAQNQQVLRVDEEDGQPIGETLMDQVMDKVRSLLPQVDLMIISDYAKGLILPPLLGRVIRQAADLRRRIVVDSKAPDYSSFKGVYLLTPNRMEASRAAQVSADHPDSVVAAGTRLLENPGVEAVLITQSEAGMTLFEKNRDPVHFPTLARKVYDVTGAGDTVVATIGLALAGGASLPVTAVLANLAAGIVVEHVGTTTITGEQLRLALQDGGFRPGIADGQGGSEGPIPGHRNITP